MRLSLRSLGCAALGTILCMGFLASGRAEGRKGSAREAHSEPRQVRNFGETAISPDGRRLAWIEDGAIRVGPLDRLETSRRITAAASPEGSCTEYGITWSPDSTALAFFSDCAALGEQPDLYLSHLDGSAPRRLTALQGYVQAAAFSPDGRRIAFLYVEGATRPAGALAAMDAPTGVIGEDHIEVQRVAAVESTAAAATPVYLTPADLHVYEFDWSADSQRLAYVAAEPPGENNWWVAKLYTQDAAGTSKPAAILAPADAAGPLHGLQIAEPRWSPDGKKIAFIGGLMSDQGVTGGDVWTIDATGGQARDLTAGRPTSAQWIAWGDDQTIYSNESADGDNRLVRLRAGNESRDGDGKTGSAATVFRYPGTVSGGGNGFSHGLTASADRSLFVFKASTFGRAPEIYAAGPAAGQAHGTKAAEGAGLVQLTHDNDGIRPAWGKAVSLHWNNDSFHIQGWLLLPANYDAAKRYPLIVEVHGGPAWEIDSMWNGGGGGLSATEFSASGYFVLMPNPRGSFGAGEAFTEANRKDFGYGDLRDILAGVDRAIANYAIDPGRVGIMGWSYGGFMSMFAVTQTHRFRAAVAGAGISDWLSYYGENSIDQWMIPYFGASVYDDPQVYARSSAINFVKNAQTPTLMVVGDRDGECPAPQSFEFWHALRDLHVPTELVVYPNEGHGFTDPAHSRDAQRRAMEWFAQYLGATP